ncbi:Dnajc3, partial [Symbiodinium sp. KB8]
VRIFRRAVDTSNNDPRAKEGLQKAEVALKQSQTKNYYKILGVPIVPYQPAERENAEKEFHDIAEAYEVLTDEEKRGRYDRGEEVNQQQGHPGGPFHHQRGGGHHFHFRFH